ncbi:hypothetical protein ACFSYH_05290 [Populibacterium corticicola]|jgi:hypothetical protein|uniref:Uncharacterized protein n=1 Tax=Populibacterium corticicola TaxID=1812826 RepID=A0ABW5XF02_9MICO
MGYFIPVGIVAVGLFVWSRIRKENKAISHTQQDGMEARTKFGRHDGGSEASAIRIISSQM